MSSVKKKITIEEYINGEFGIFEDNTDIMGLTRDEMIATLITKVFPIE